MSNPPESLRAIDSSVLLRYMLDDIPDQAARARKLVESDSPIGITAVALAEVAWVLSGPQQRNPAAAVAARLIQLLARANVHTLGFDKQAAQGALASCTRTSGAAGLGDALIAACARSAGVHEIFTFDRRFARTGLLPVIPR